jgi:hypothetical protein
MDDCSLPIVSWRTRSPLRSLAFGVMLHRVDISSLTKWPALGTCHEWHATVDSMKVSEVSPTMNTLLATPKRHEPYAGAGTRGAVVTPQCAASHMCAPCG